MYKAPKSGLHFQMLLVLLQLAALWIFPASGLSDGQSLLAIKQAWKLNHSTWQGDNPCLGWEGVQCDGNQRVTYLNLSNTGISGAMPSELGNLDHLTVLDLCNGRNSKPPYNVITGDLSPLGSLTNLVDLNVSFNHIALDSFPKVIFNLTNLISLRIDNNLIQGPIPIEITKLTKLKYLYLGNNSLSGQIPKELAELVDLQELSLWNNNLLSTIPPEFGNFQKLQYLNLHDCNLYGGLPAELGNIHSLTNITLHSNQLTGSIPDMWKNLTNLRYLYLYNNYLTKTIPTWLLDLPNFYNLSVGYNLFYGSLNLDNIKLPIVSVTCNFLTGQTPIPPSPSTMLLNDTGNCFDGADSDPKIRCIQSYYDCNDFFQQVSNETCPRCPTTQVLADASTCVCTFDTATGKVSSHEKEKLIGSIVGVGCLMALVLVIWWRWPKANKNSRELWEGPDGVQRYLYRELSKATNNFNISHEIGSGGFGKVYCGVVDGREVAIKRAHSSSIQSSSGFRNEVVLLSRLHHKNLVRLLGFCEEEGIQILVYEYMPNGNLHTLLFKNNVIELNWLRRLDIALGIAQGLEYLHSFADPPVIHRDVKPSNVLLDNNLVAKLSDFGISKVAAEFQTQFATRPAGTVGYIDPQYILREHLTTASDVYSFGMVLLELISGQKSIDNTRLDEHNLVEWAKLKLASEGIKCIVDPRLGDNYPEKVYYDMVRLAVDCASFASQDRPSMKVVVSILDTCRWSVAPDILEQPGETHVSLEESDVENYTTTESSQQALAKDMENSFADGESSSIFSENSTQGFVESSVARQ